MEEKGTVKSISGKMLTVSVLKTPRCKKCGQCMDCRVSEIYLNAESDLNVKIGDTVIVDIGPSDLAVSAMIYGVPSLFFISGLMMGVYLFHSELLGFLLSVIFLAAAFIIIKLCNFIRPDIFLPKIKKLAEEK